MAGRQRNLEVKAIDPDPQATFAAAVALGAQDREGQPLPRRVPVGYADLLARRGRAA
jgi:hypothetical protein